MKVLFSILHRHTIINNNPIKLTQTSSTQIIH